MLQDNTVGPGAKKREDIYEAFETIYPVLQQFKKGDPQPMAPPPPLQNRVRISLCTQFPRLRALKYAASCTRLGKVLNECRVRQAITDASQQQARSLLGAPAQQL